MEYSSYLYLKNSRIVQEFSKKVEPWIPLNCLCRFCENYIYQADFTNIHES